MTQHLPRVWTIEDLRGPAGRLEAILNSGRADAAYAAIICHPHPKGGGTMHNKVVYHAMKTFSSLGLPVVRFNFRGVGLSEGEHDAGRGEQDDVRAVLDWMDAKLKLPILFAGFSFGSNVGLRACCGDSRVKGLVGWAFRCRRRDAATAMDFCRGARGRSSLSAETMISTGRASRWRRCSGRRPSRRRSTGSRGQTTFSGNGRLTGAEARADAGNPARVAREELQLTGLGLDGFQAA